MLWGWKRGAQIIKRNICVFLAPPTTSQQLAAGSGASVRVRVAAGVSAESRINAAADWLGPSGLLQSLLTFFR